jgi:hypothetical protein
MIAWAGAERLALGLRDTLDTAPLPRWPLADVRGPLSDETVAPAAVVPPAAAPAAAPLDTPEQA